LVEGSKVQNTACARFFSKTLFFHPAVDGYLALFRAAEGERRLGRGVARHLGYTGVGVGSLTATSPTIIDLYGTNFFFQPSSVHGWTLAFLLAVHRLCGAIEGRLSHFLPRWLRTGWQSVRVEILRRGWEFNPGHRKGRQ